MLLAGCTSCRSCIRELLLKKISELGFDPKQFGLHSLRMGGATAAANAWVPDYLFKRHTNGSSSLPRMAMWKTQ